ncbi:MAG: hypothetical protein HUU55_03105 [Myxococcales bacterium]|nr:hypothetical protein [Myxococcales bacterium]
MRTWLISAATILFLTATFTFVGAGCGGDDDENGGIVVPDTGTDEDTGGSSDTGNGGGDLVITDIDEEDTSTTDTGVAEDIQDPQDVVDTQSNDTAIPDAESDSGTDTVDAQDEDSGGKDEDTQDTEDAVVVDCIETCSDTYAPLCCDGKGFDNDCLAGCAGFDVSAFQDGTCKKGKCNTCPCVDEQDQCGGKGVCGKNNKSYTQWCDFQCDPEISDVVLDKKNCGLCKASDNCSKCQDPYYPKCGSDGFTYDSPCKLEHCAPQTTTLACDGLCPAKFVDIPACDACDDTCEPVCGYTFDGDITSFRNACFLECAGGTVIHTGACCDSPKDKAPVCGKDLKTYPNSSFATCANTTIFYEGTCVCDCDMNVTEPVCGIDGITYQNECAAACAKVEVLSQGVCK